MNRWLDRIQIWCCDSLVISDDLINFWEKVIKSKMADRGYLKNMAAQKVCGRDILWNVGWIAFKFDVVVLGVFLMIWITFEKNSLKQDGRWRTFWKNSHWKSLWVLWTIGWMAFKFYAVVLSPCPIRSDRQTTSPTLTTGAPYSCTNGRGCEQHEYSLWRHRFTDCSVEVTLRSDCLGCLNWPGRRGVLNS